MKIYQVILLILIGGIQYVQGQDVLRLDEAIQVALENNHSILVAKNDAEISANNAHPGAAGLLPTVNGTAGANYNNNSVNVEFATSDFPPVEADGVESTAINAGLNLNYTVFDGLANVNSFRVLKKTAKLSETQTQAVIEATISQVAAAYYSVARLSEAYNTLSESVEISKERLSRARNQQEFGSSNKLGVLNAEVDLNTDSANLAVTYFNLDNAKRSLNALLGREVSTPFLVSTDVAFVEDLVLKDLMAMAMQNNAQIKIAAYNQEIANLNLKVTQAGYMPIFGINAGYNYNKAENGPGNILRSQESLGLTLGASLTIPIFSGNQRKVSVQNARINVLSSRQRNEETLLNLERDLSNAFYTYQSSLRQLTLEQKSLESAGENFSRTQEAFKLGQATNIQFRDAQLNLQRVKDRIHDLRYSAKLNEIEVLRLSGKLTQGQ